MTRHENGFVGYKVLAVRLDIGLVRSMDLCTSVESLSTWESGVTKIAVGKDVCHDWYDEKVLNHASKSIPKILWWCLLRAFRHTWLCLRHHCDPGLHASCLSSWLWYNLVFFCPCIFNCWMSTRVAKSPMIHSQRSEVAYEYSKESINAKQSCREGN